MSAPAPISLTADASVAQSGPPAILYRLNGGVLQLAQHDINYPSTGPGNSGQVQIFKGGVGTVDIGSSGSTQLAAAVSAPFSTLVGNGQTFHFPFAGSLLLDSYTCNGQPDFKFSYNQAAASLTRDWTVSYCREIPSNQVP